MTLTRREQQLQNLARARSIRQANLRSKQRVSPPPRQRVSPQKRIQKRIFVPRGRYALNPQMINPDLDVSKVDLMINEEIMASGERLFQSIEDVVPRAILRRGK